MTNVSASGRPRNPATVGLIAGSSVAWCSLVLNTANSRSKIRFSVSASHVAGSARNVFSTAATFRSLSSHGVSTGRNTSSRRLARSRQRVGRLSNMVMAYRLTQNRFWPKSRSSSKRPV